MSRDPFVPPRLATDVPKTPCPWCGGGTSTVFRSAGAGRHTDTYRRRRQCAECGREFPTIEILDAERFQRQVTLAGLTLRDVGWTPEELDRRRRRG
jgi:hypothetical protein